MSPYPRKIHLTNPYPQNAMSSSQYTQRLISPFSCECPMKDIRILIATFSEGHPYPMYITSLMEDHPHTCVFAHTFFHVWEKIESSHSVSRRYYSTNPYHFAQFICESNIINKRGYIKARCCEIILTP